MAAAAGTSGRVPEPTRVTPALVPEPTRVATPTAAGMTDPRTVVVPGGSVTAHGGLGMAHRF
jgi:hypothetical protein